MKIEIREYFHWDCKLDLAKLEHLIRIETKNYIRFISIGSKIKIFDYKYKKIAHEIYMKEGSKWKKDKSSKNNNGHDKNVKKTRKNKSTRIT